MTPQDLTTLLTARFGDRLQASPPDAWQVETDAFRLLVLLSANQSWLRILVPIVPAPTAQPFMGQILEANFDLTQDTRYALHQDVLWGVFQQAIAEVSPTVVNQVIDRLLVLKQEGIDPFFNVLVDTQIRQIIRMAKRQGQTLEETLKTLDRFYSEGMMGDMALGDAYKDQVLAAWQRQLERLWPEVEA
ncbi:MAG: hypothetical protein IGR92_07185 [Leptolyngbyaceae cyanobacterium T60_A2020_046]|nr:hypothetical protein [Leptolyngbyaceae cyanobacterium T60_A2020_046]